MMITQKQIDARDEFIQFLFDDLVDEITAQEAVQYRNFKKAIADADKEAEELK